MLTSLINKALDSFSNVVVFTQDHEDILDFIVNGSGRFDVAWRSNFWDVNRFRNDKVTFLKMIDGFKAAFTNHKDAQMSLDLARDCRITFTKNPFFPIHPRAHVIKKNFSLPHLSVIPKYIPSLLMADIDGPIDIRLKTQFDYLNRIDQFTMQDIDFATYASGKESRVRLLKPGTFTHGQTIVLEDLIDIQELFCFNEHQNIILVYDETSLNTISYKTCLNALQVFADLPDQAIDENLISFRTWKHPKTIKSILQLLEIAGCIKMVRQDQNLITIQKSGIGPEDDKLFHLIPDGNITAGRLAVHMGIDRAELFKVLKQYEVGGHLKFSYVQRRAAPFWKFEKELTQHDYRGAIGRVVWRNQMLEMLKLNDFEKLNAFMDERIQRHSFSNNISSQLISDVNIEEVSNEQEKIEI